MPSVLSSRPPRIYNIYVEMFFEAYRMNALSARQLVGLGPEIAFQPLRAACDMFTVNSKTKA